MKKIKQPNADIPEKIRKAFVAKTNAISHFNEMLKSEAPECPVKEGDLVYVKRWYSKDHWEPCEIITVNYNPYNPKGWGGFQIFAQPMRKDFSAKHKGKNPFWLRNGFKSECEIKLR